MGKMTCVKRHFGAGGKLVEVGDEKEGNPDGTYWVPKGSQQFVTNPANGGGDGKKNVKDMVADIAVSEDRDFLEGCLEDDRKGVVTAAEQRLEELEANGGGDGE